MARSKTNRKHSPDANDLLLVELKEIYSAESQLARALPRLEKAVESDTLKKLLDKRQEQGERIIQELDKCFEELETSPGRKKNAAAEGLIGDLREHVQELEQGPALDLVLTGAMQKIEHYCIAAWGTAKSLANVGQKSEVVSVMNGALEEGKSYDAEMTNVAESELAPALLSSGAESEEDEEGDQPTSARQRKGGSSEQHARH